jgi:hypothetical protein
LDAGSEIKRHVAFAGSGKWAKEDEKWNKYVLAVAEWRGYSAIGRNVSVKSSNEPIKNFWFHLKEATKLDCPLRFF